jgi:hypothetical protein
MDIEQFEQTKGVCEMSKPVQIYKVTSEIDSPEKFKSVTLPPHADMLRYDSAYHDPDNPTRVIFPKFKGYTVIIHHDRWKSFLLKVEGTGEWINPSDCMNWIGYWYDNVHNLFPETLEEKIKRSNIQLAK